MSLRRPSLTVSALLVVGLLLSALRTPLYAQDYPSVEGADTELGQAISDAIDTEPFEGAFWGIHVVNLRTGTVLYSRNADQNFTPASNVKLFTTAAALEQLGPSYRYQTRVYVDGPAREDALQGNLIVRGSGDPTIGGYEHRTNPTWVFRQWADSLQRRGITHITGNIVGDDSRINGTRLGDGWSWSDLSYEYAAEIGGLVFNRNTVDLRVQGREVGEPGRVTWEPFETDFVRVVNRSRTVPYRLDEDEEYQRTVGTNTIHVRTRVHPNSTETESIAVTEPTRYFTHVFREVLLREGVSVEGHAADLRDTAIMPQYDSEEVRRVASYTSPPLSEIARTLNQESENLYAEQLLRTLAAERPPESTDEHPPGSAALGIEAVKKTLVQAEIDTSTIELVDGSGLSHHNMVRPRALVRLLQYMWLHPNPPVSSAFYDSLPQGGQDGTLRYRFRGSAPARANVRAKTGTLSNTSSLSGYVTSERGTPLAFAVLCNHHLAETKEARATQDVIVNALARLPL